MARARHAVAGARGLLFVTEVSSGDNRQVAMLPWNLPSSAQTKPRIAIARKLLFAEPDPILDILLLDSKFPNAGLDHTESGQLPRYGGPMDAL
jgi:hypothetical protein